MSEYEKATAVILTHNRRQEVTRTVERMSALAENVPIIVVDNASRDGTAEHLSERFPQIRVLWLPENRGAAARNVGIRAARTPYVALCDDDTWWAAGSIGRAAALLDEYASLAIVCGRVLVGPEGREDPTCAAMAASPLRSPRSLPGPALLGFLAGASMVRREAFLQVGGFDPRFFLGGEEALPSVDLVAAGWDIAYVREIRVHHHPSTRRDVSARGDLLLRNALWFTWLRRPWRSALPRTFALLHGALRERRGLKGAVHALRGLPWIAKTRCIVPEYVECQLRHLEKDQGNWARRS